MSHDARARLSDLRRTFHRHPEPGWREFQTTARVVEELERIGVDEIAVGREALATDARMAVPDDDEIQPWLDRARRAGVSDDLLERTAGGHTGVVATLSQGEGPCIGLRVDLDAISIHESEERDHRPEAEGFRSEHDGYMHACGHDAHLAIALGTLEAVKQSAFEGTLKVLFQPAEEISGGGKAMAESGHLDGVDYLFALHVGLDHPTGEIVAGVESPLAMAHLTATFEGASAHAGKAPNEGANAMQAAAVAIQNAYGIARHRDGATRVNVGRIEGGSASNVIAEEVTIDAEVRGETTALMTYARTELERILYAAAELHDCDVTPHVISESPCVDSHPALQEVVGNVAWGVDGVEHVIPSEEFGVSEDGTYLMQQVQDAGGLASYVLVGTDHPTSHHTPTFDIDEESLAIGVNILSETFVELSRRRP
ncbi:amidohydrolase [Halorubrum lacusprofundi]|jgi:aminobenzoyl-glutamate utilization protein A|uniref:Amidohydrolase n=1 Tax=Halorubrum lacusprofundi (strain ATCC 49239 / DSM 5036 / JCM 8891 / ACAM 34) TaxID=416348 RepID=B9LMR6_HALLT|nr:amidohydrolase [Halorubrum lacusprofundi]ACM56654.1 amidohydrolase [Halorubrum lacusprofundi ATCC 49239]